MDYLYGSFIYSALFNIDASFILFSSFSCFVSFTNSTQTNTLVMIKERMSAIGAAISIPSIPI